jgi:eukaryotic-like serine/threonine-protein kinase
LALDYFATGEFEKALATGKEALQLSDTDTFAYQRIAISYESLNRFEEARAVAQEAISKKADSGPLHVVLFELAFLKRDQAAMDKELSEGKGTERGAFMLGMKAAAEMALGKISLAQNSLHEAEASALRNGMKEFAAVITAQAGKRVAAYGDCSSAKTQTVASLARIPDGENRRIAALALAQCGDGTAKKLIEAEAKARPQDSLVQGVFVPLIDALNSLQKGDGSAAVAILEPARRYEPATTPPNAPYWILYTRGKAHLLLKEPDKAAAEFRKILDFRGRDATSELIPLSQLQLARAYVMQNDSAKARTAYQDFLAMWKDADPDIPVLLAAKSEYAKLQ